MRVDIVPVGVVCRLAWLSSKTRRPSNFYFQASKTTRPIFLFKLSRKFENAPYSVTEGAVLSSKAMSPLCAFPSDCKWLAVSMTFSTMARSKRLCSLIFSFPEPRVGRPSVSLAFQHLISGLVVDD